MCKYIHRNPEEKHQNLIFFLLFLPICQYIYMSDIYIYIF